MEALIELRVRDFDIFAQAQSQTEFRDAIGQHRRTPNQYGLCELFIHDDLHRAQHSLVFTLGKNDASFGARTHKRFGGREHRTHECA